ncbi:MAG: PP2C family protein-serine/threonine phosphatase [Candidatus Kapaibacteriota bacterium]
MEIKTIVKPSYILTGIFLLFVHFVTNFLFTFLKFEYNFLWRLFELMWILLVTILIVLAYFKSKVSKFVSASKFGEHFLENSKTLAFSGLIFLFLNLIFQMINIFYSSHLLKLIHNEINLIFYVSFSFLFFSYQLGWIFQIKRKNIHLLMKGLYLSIFLYVFILTTEILFSEQSLFKGSELKYFIVLTFAFLFLFSFNIKPWVPLSTRTVQKNIFWFSLLMIGILIPMLGIENDNFGIYYSNVFFLGTTQIFAFSLLLTYIRAFYYTMISLPFSRVIEQKVYEVNTLAYLSRIVRNYNNLDGVYEAIVELSYNSMKRSPSLLQLYRNSLLSGVKSSYENEIDEKIIEFALTEETIQKIIRSVERPTVVPSLSEKLNPDHIGAKLIFESMCVVPIFFNDEITGHLVVMNKIPYFFDEDDLSLLVSFVETLEISIEGNHLLLQTIEKEKYKRELLIAKEMQNNFLPKGIPKINNLEIEIFFKPSDEVGGDFYDIIQIGNNKILFLIGDVSGKGMSAAFYMALLKGIILASETKTCSMFDLFCHLNDSLYNHIDKRIHLTMAGLLIDTEAKNFEFLRAGHLPLITISGNSTNITNTCGIGISLVSSPLFSKYLKSYKGELHNSTYLLLFTDGLVEALGNKEFNLGLQVLKRTIENSVYKNSAELKEIILEEVNKNGTIFDDDISLLIIRYFER